MFVYALYTILIFLFLVFAIQYTYNELWEHHVEKRRAHVIVHAIFLVAASAALVWLIIRNLIKLL